MRIKQLQIKGFRNLQPLTLDLTQENPVHAFIGANGQGKTNILEAIYVCCLSKSFRGRGALDLVGFEQDFSTVQCETEEGKLEVVITARPSQKVLKINGVKKKASDFVGHLKAVFFSPDDLAYMAYAPKLRRRYLDVVLSQLEPEYLEQLMVYQDAVKQRNSLLKMIKEHQANRDELPFWDEKCAELGSRITSHRGSIVEKLEELVEYHYRAISKTEAVLKINYKSEVRGCKKAELLEMYRKEYTRDIVTGQTHLGPHRDDLEFLLDGHDMAQFSSRGEWRSLVLGLKFAEIDLIKERTGESPVLLLDDVFSELDADRQKYLFEAIGESQTFVTTTHQEFVDALPVRPNIYRVQSGLLK